MSLQELPLFPLNTVMFPGASLTLHIFEERYREMIGRCLEESSPFGILLIREGQEVGVPALPYTVGTLVQINASVRLEDGRLLIATVGQRRFQLQDMVQSMPYLVGSVELLPEEDGTRLTALADDLRGIYTRYWAAISTATGTQSEAEQLPDDVTALSYQLANQLQVTNERKQRWLEADARTRLREIGEMLRAEIRMLPAPGSDSGTPNTPGTPWSWN